MASSSTSPTSTPPATIEDIRAALLAGAGPLCRRVRENAATMPTEQLADILDVLVSVAGALAPRPYERVLPALEPFLTAMTEELRAQTSSRAGVAANTERSGKAQERRGGRRSRLPEADSGVAR